MTLTQFTRDVVPLFQLAVSMLGLLSLFVLAYQLKQTAKWNKVTAHHSLVTYLPEEAMEQKVLSLLDGLSVPRDVPIPKEAAERIYEDQTAFVVVKSYLNKFEHFCAAINSGAIDEDHAYKLHAGRVTYVQKIFREFVDVARLRRNYPSAYIELDRVAHRWNPRKDRDKAEEAAENEKRRLADLEHAGVSNRRL